MAPKHIKWTAAKPDVFGTNYVKGLGSIYKIEDEIFSSARGAELMRSPFAPKNGHSRLRLDTSEFVFARIVLIRSSARARSRKVSKATPGRRSEGEASRSPSDKCYPHHSVRYRLERRKICRKRQSQTRQRIHPKRKYETPKHRRISHRHAANAMLPYPE